jgi:hypothetical protein
MSQRKAMQPQPASRIRRHGLRLLTLLALLIGSISSVFAGTAARTTVTSSAEYTAAASRVFLPMAVKSGSVTPPSTAGSIFLNRTVKTASASTAIDGSGGYHVAYIHYVPEAEHPPAVYGFCSGTGCKDKANWREVTLLDKTREVQLALTAAGQPRLLIVTSSEVYNGGKDYHYAECNAGCTDRANWKVTRTFSSWGTITSEITTDHTPQRSFALDPQGRPRFIYQDRNYFYKEPDHYGAFYAYCDANCTVAANWKETEVGRFINYDAEIFDLPSLTFTSSGQPRIVSRVFAIDYDGSGGKEGLYYYECNGGCDQNTNWKRAFLIPTGGGSYPFPGWDIELDAQNRPRVVIFTGDGIDPEQYERHLLYLWCDQGCTNPANWFFNSLGHDRNDGEAPDLELNAQGQPRIAWIDDTGNLGYSWCNTNCQSDTPQWQGKVVETEAMWRQEFPQAIPLNCEADLWTGLAPVLKLDGAGNPRIALDTSVEGSCLYDDPNDGQPPYRRFMPVWRAARLTFFVQP